MHILHTAVLVTAAGAGFGTVLRRESYVAERITTYVKVLGMTETCWHTRTAQHSTAALATGTTNENTAVRSAERARKRYGGGETIAHPPRRPVLMRRSRSRRHTLYGHTCVRHKQQHTRGYSCGRMLGEWFTSSSHGRPVESNTTSTPASIYRPGVTSDWNAAASSATSATTPVHSLGHRRYSVLGTRRPLHATLVICTARSSEPRS